MAYKLTDEDLRLAQMMADQQLAAQKPKSSGILGDILSTVGGIGGGILGSFVAPVAGTIGGGAIGSGLGRGLANLLTGVDAGEGVVQDAAFGAAGGALGKFLKIGGAAAKGAKTATQAGANAVGAAPKSGLLSRFGQTLEGGGNKLMASQANLTRAQARNLSEPIADTFGKLNTRTGIGNMDDLTQIGGKITGKNGIVSNEIRSGLKPVSVDISDLRKVTDDALIDLAPGVQGAARKGITENIKNNVIKAYGGSKGSLSSVVGGEDAFKVVQGFEKQASTYANAFKRAGNVTDDQTAKVYQKLAGTIKDRLYSANGAQEAFAKTAKPKIISEMNAEAVELAAEGNKKGAVALRRLAKEFDGVENIKDARTFQRDFVQLGNIAEKTGQAEMGAAMQLGGNNMQGLGRFAQNPLNMAAAPLNSQSGKVGSLLARAGQKLQGKAAQAGGEAAAGGSRITRKDLIKSLIAQGVPRAALGGFSGSDANAELAPDAIAMLAANPEQFTAEQLVQSGAMQDGGAPAGVFGAREVDGKQMGMTKESLDAAIIDAASKGDEKTVGMLLNVAEYFGAGAGGGSGLSAAGQKSMVASDNALSSVQRLEQLLGQTGGQDNGVLARIMGGAQGIAGGAGLDDNARIYNDVAGSLVTPLARAISGETGTLSDQDIKRAQGMIPQLTDSNRVRQEKIQQMYAAIQAAQQNTMRYGGGGGGDMSQLAAMFGGM